MQVTVLRQSVDECGRGDAGDCRSTPQSLAW
jgi:hypothetical protein